MKLNEQTIYLIKSFEGLRLAPYLCSAGRATIGYGNTYYEDGTPVKLSDPSITEARAEALLINKLAEFSNRVTFLLWVELNPNQFGALVSFAYNVGVSNLKKSTLLKKVNSHPLHKDIRSEFLKWTKANGEVLLGLQRRREAEANLYFKNN